MFSDFSLFALLLFFLPIMAPSQTIQDDFEGNGTITTWYGDNCGINTNLANPFQQGINNSATVLEYQDNGGQYANVRFDIGNNLYLALNHNFSLKIYVPSNGLTGSQPNQVSLKLQDGTLAEPWSTQTEIIKPLALNEWQTVTFDFEKDAYINLDGNSPPPAERKDFNRVLLQINGENNTDHVLAYIDDFHYNVTIPADHVFDNLVWSDEFDIDGAVDGTKWFHQTQLPAFGSWFNGELQHYTNRADNSFVENGLLNIVAKKETFTDQGYTKSYTSARLNSKFSFKYGRVEIRAKLPTGVGTWPALWMLGKNINENGAYWDNQGFGTTPWPYCGEIDIMEHWGKNQNYVQSATHTPSSFGATFNLGGQTVPTASSEFHVYALEWTPEKLVFSVDDAIHYIYNPAIKDADTWPFDDEQYILLNIAIEEIIDPGFSQSSMEIDYVRVYQAGMVPAAQVDDTAYQFFYPNPVYDALTINIEKAIERNIALNIYSPDGTLVKQYNKQVDNNRIVLDGLGDLSSGMYIILYEYNLRKYSLKIIKG
ncbi:MAG: family 16 glycosylhydrolase [Lewinellaceae bacterium]|nr:family 16 glycosylhydrolase [Saprospiraceae bacterium]MCB9338378.1 family 16 glycosylhydrolase [Lewinellaceae bacterium]